MAAVCPLSVERHVVAGYTYPQAFAQLLAAIQCLDCLIGIVRMCKLHKAEGRLATTCLSGFDADALDLAILVEDVINLLQSQHKNGTAKPRHATLELQTDPEAV